MACVALFVVLLFALLTALSAIKPGAVLLDTISEQISLIGSSDVFGEIWSISPNQNIEKFNVLQSCSLAKKFTSDVTHGGQPISIKPSCQTCQRSCDQATLSFSNSTEPHRIFPSQEVCIAFSFHPGRIDVQYVPLPGCDIVCSILLFPFVYFLCDKVDSTDERFITSIFFNDFDGWHYTSYDKSLPANGVLFQFDDIYSGAFELYYAYTMPSSDSKLKLYFRGVDGSGYHQTYELPPICAIVVRLTTIGNQELLIECANVTTSEMISNVHRFDFNKKQFHTVASDLKYRKCLVRFSPDNATVAICAADDIIIADLDTEKQRFTSIEVDAPIFDCVFTAIGTLVYASQKGLFVVKFELSLDKSKRVLSHIRINQSECFVCTHIGCPLLDTLGPNMVVTIGNNSITLFSIDPPQLLDSAHLTHPSSRLVSTYNTSMSAVCPIIPPTFGPKGQTNVPVIAGSIVVAVAVLICVAVLIGIVYKCRKPTLPHMIPYHNMHPVDPIAEPIMQPAIIPDAVTNGDGNIRPPGNGCEPPAVGNGYEPNMQPPAVANGYEPIMQPPAVGNGYEPNTEAMEEFPDNDNSRLTAMVTGT